MRGSFQRKLVLAISVLAVGSTAGSVLFFYGQTKEILFSQMGNRLKDIGRTAVSLFQPEDITAIESLQKQLNAEMKAAGPVFPPIEPGKYSPALPPAVSERLMKGPEFQRLIRVLSNVKNSTRQRDLQNLAEFSEPTIEYATIITSVDVSPDKTIVQFLADPDYALEENPNPIGNLFHNNSSALRMAFRGAANADDAFRFEQGQILFSAGIPIRNTQGDIIAILALDYDASSEANQVQHLRHICALVILASILLSLLVSLMLARYLHRPIKTLRAGAEKVAARDFSPHIELQSNDELGLLAQAFNTMVKEIRNYAQGLEEVNAAYARFVPAEFLKHLGKDDIVKVELGDQIQRQMTVLFSDIRSFTTISESMSPRDNFDFINEYLQVVCPIIRKHNGFVDKFIGDGVMALFPESTESAIRAAIDMQRALPALNAKNNELGRPPIRIGIGLHNGNLMLGTVGEKLRMEGTVISDAVNLAARLEGVTKEYGASIILSERALSSVTRKDFFHDRYLGQVQVKGKKVEIPIFEVIDGDDEDAIRRKIITKPDFEKGVRAFERGELFRATRYFRRVLKIHRSDLACQMFLGKLREARTERGAVKPEGTNSGDKVQALAKDPSKFSTTG